MLVGANKKHLFSEMVFDAASLLNYYYLHNDEKSARQRRRWCSFIYVLYVLVAFRSIFFLPFPHCIRYSQCRATSRHIKQLDADTEKQAHKCSAMVKTEERKPICKKRDNQIQGTRYARRGARNARNVAVRLCAESRVRIKNTP